MTVKRESAFWVNYLKELCRLPNETEWVEFKHNKANPDEIGEYISALSNSAALASRPHAYVVWGVTDRLHEPVGTTFSPSNLRVGAEEIKSWLLRLLSPRIHFEFFEFFDESKKFVLLEIDQASHRPVQFRNQEYVRVGSYKKLLKDYPELERRLWKSFETTPFEAQIAAEALSSTDVLRLIEYPAYFDLLKMPLPEERASILQSLSADAMISRSTGGTWNITNLGAILFAKKLDEFRALSRKAIRVVLYNSNSRVDPQREIVGNKGYAIGYNGLIEYINNLLPSNEVIEKALRKKVMVFPELAIRELVANAIIHQDFSVYGASPLIEVFKDRIEITNPGLPLVDTQRFLDSPPRSRNEALAAFMRRIGICEERGSGIDTVVFECEFNQLPAPIFETAANNTRAVLLAHRPLSRMNKDDKVRSCYLHACLRYVNREYMTNASLRERFGLSPNR